MDSGKEISSSSYLSNASTGHNAPSAAAAAAACDESPSGANLELLSLNILSSSLEKLVVSRTEYDYTTDAEIEVEGIAVGVHRCILAARSPFFHECFKKGSGGSGEGRKPKYRMSDLVAQGWTIGYDAFMVVLNYLYTGKVKPSPHEVSTCVDDSCPHDACGPAINYAVEMMYASSAFQINELVMLVQRQLHNYVAKAFAEDVIPILKVAYHSMSKQLCSDCVQRIALSDLDDVIIDKELELYTEVLDEIRSIRNKSKQEEEQDVDSIDYKRIRSIHKALDSDDIELVDLLMKESKISLDVAYALHYAAAYCNPKILNKVLNLGNVDVNLKNPRGHTVLHVAARRKDPSVIMRMLNLGASVSVPTRDGRTALTISQRLTRPKDYLATVKQGEETNKDRLCIDVLEREMVRPLFGNMSMSTMAVAGDLHMGLLLFENRVAMARSLFPLEARLAMQIAEADVTPEFAGNFMEADPNKMSEEQVRRQQKRLHALQKTVATGRRFFPHCSEFLDRLSEDDALGALMLEKGTPEEQKKKRTRYMELKDEVLKAFSKDMENHFAKASSSTLSSCSSSAKALHKGRKR